MAGSKARAQLGVGVDIEEVTRFTKRSSRAFKLFLKRLFTDQELTYCFERTRTAEHLAARFAAKEAIIKALAILGFAPPDYQQIEIRMNGKLPTVCLYDSSLKPYRVLISLSHTRTLAMAFAVITA